MNALSLNSPSANLAIWLMASILVLPMPADTLLGLALLGLIVSHLSRGSRFSIDTLSALWISTLALVTYTVCSLFWSQTWDGQDIVQVGLRGLLCILFIVAISDARAMPQEFMLVLARCTALALLVSVPISIALWMQSPPHDTRLEGLFRLNNAGKYGRTLAVILPLLLAGVIYDTRRWQPVLIVAVVLTLTALAMTDTRSAWLGALAGIVAFAVATWKPQPHTFIVTLGLIGMVLLTTLLVMVFHPNPEVTRLLLPRGDSFRLLIWNEHLEAIRTGSTLFGHGFFAEVIVHSGEVAHRGAHNMYLSVLLQGGLVALGLFLFVIIGATARLISRLQLPLARCCLAMLLAGLVMFVFDGDRLIDKMNMVWLALWLPVAVALTCWEQTNPPGD